MELEELIRIKPNDLEWFISHYKESKTEILEMLWEYIKNSPLTVHDCYIGCSHLNQINELTNAKISLNVHLEIISKMSLVGINASKAAQYIRLALLKINEHG